MEKDNLDIEKPKLNLERKEKENLPKEIPDVFAAEEQQEVEQIIEHEAEIKIEPLIKDVEIELKIKNFVDAKDLYKRLVRVYNGLTEEEKKTYFPRILAMYDELKDAKLPKVEPAR